MTYRDSQTQTRPRNEIAFKIIRRVLMGSAAFLCLSVVSCSWYTVDQTERGVVLRNGAILRLDAPGVHTLIPFVDAVEQISVANQVSTWERMQAYSNDQQTAVLRLSTTWRVIDPLRLYEMYRTRENALTTLLFPRVPEAVKAVFGRFNAVTSIQDRTRLNAEVEMAVQTALAGHPIEVVSVQIENIDFSDTYEQSIEARMQAEVAVQRLRQEAEQATVQAQIRVTQATAAAQAVRLQGEAEAAAIQARGAALRANQDLVQLQAVEKWNGQLPTMMVPGSALPFLQLNRP